MRLIEIFKSLLTPRNHAAPPPAALPPTPEPAPDFDEKLEKYAARGLRQNLVFTQDPVQNALIPAASVNDTDFLREALARQPELVTNKNLILRDTLMAAIINDHVETTAFLLDEVKVPVSYEEKDQYGHDISSRLPQWDAAFVAATGEIPRHFIHKAGTVWQSPAPDSPNGVTIFNMIVDKLAAQHEGNQAALRAALTKDFSLLDQHYGGDFAIATTKSSHANTLDAARPAIRQRLTEILAGLDRAPSGQAPATRAPAP